MTKRNLEVIRVEDIQAAQGLEQAWNRLLQDNDTKTTELTYEWQMTYWKYFNEGASLFILAVKDGDAVVGIAPLKLSHARKSGLPVRRLEFIAAEQSNYQDFIVGGNKEDVLDAVFEHLVTSSRLWDVFKLSHVPEDSPTVQLFLTRHSRHFLYREQRQPCIFLKLDRSWEEYTSQSTGARKKMARSFRKLQQVVRCDVTCSGCSSEAQLSFNLPRFFDLHCAQWNQTSTPSQFNDNRYRQFYLDVSSQLSPKRQVNLFALEAAGQPLAFNYTFLFDRTCLAQLTTYDTNFARCAPGLVVFEFLVKECFADGTIETIDFGDYYPYKELWAESLKNKVDFRIYPRRPWPICIYVLTGLCSRLRTRLSQHPRLMEQAERLHRRIAASTAGTGLY